MASKELNSDDFIKHHLQNLTFGKCNDGYWRFADGHINIGSEEALQEAKAYQEAEEIICDPKEMGFNAIHVDTMAMSLLLGGLFCFFFWIVAKKASVKNPTKLQNAIEYAFNFVRTGVNDIFVPKGNKIIGPLALTSTAPA